MPRKTPLFVTYGGGHATMMAPVARALREEGFDVPVLALTMGRKPFVDAGLPFLGFRDFLRENDREALAHGERLAGAMHEERTGIPREESVAYLGLSYQDLVERHGAAEAERLFAEKGRMAFLPLGVMERIFDRLKPDVVVTTNSPRAELAARLVARRRGLPVAAVTDLLGTYAHPLDVDLLLVACASAVERYRRASNVSAREIAVVGNPAMDGALRHRGSADPEARAKRFPGAPAGAAFALAAEQYSSYRPDGRFVRFTPAEILGNLERLHAAARERNAVLVLRPHPSLGPELYRGWAESKPAGTAFMAERDELYPLLRQVDLVISNFSTIMLDALYMERPVLLVHYPESTTLLPFDRLGFAFSAPIDDPRALSSALGGALTDREARRRMAAAFQAEFPALPCAPRAVAALKAFL